MSIPSGSLRGSPMMTNKNYFGSNNFVQNLRTSEPRKQKLRMKYLDRLSQHSADKIQKKIKPESISFDHTLQRKPILNQLKKNMDKFNDYQENIKSSLVNPESVKFPEINVPSKTEIVTPGGIHEKFKSGISSIRHDNTAAQSGVNLDPVITENVQNLKDINLKMASLNERSESDVTETV